MARTAPFFDPDCPPEVQAVKSGIVFESSAGMGGEREWSAIDIDRRELIRIERVPVTDGGDSRIDLFKNRAKADPRLLLRIGQNVSFRWAELVSVFRLSDRNILNLKCLADEFLLNSNGAWSGGPTDSTNSIYFLIDGLQVSPIGERENFEIENRFVALLNGIFLSYP